MRHHSLALELLMWAFVEIFWVDQVPRSRPRLCFRSHPALTPVLTEWLLSYLSYLVTLTTDTRFPRPRVGTFYGYYIGNKVADVEVGKQKRNNMLVKGRKKGKKNPPPELVRRGFGAQRLLNSDGAYRAGLAGPGRCRCWIRSCCPKAEGDSWRPRPLPVGRR